MSGVKRGQGLKATYCDVCVCGTYVRTYVHARGRGPRPAGHARDLTSLTT